MIGHKAVLFIGAIILSGTPALAQARVSHNAPIPEMPSPFVGRYTSDASPGWEFGPQLTITRVDAFGNVSGELKGWGVEGKMPLTRWKAWSIVFAPGQPQAATGMARISNDTLTIQRDGQTIYQLGYDGSAFTGKYVGGGGTDTARPISFMRAR